MITRYDLDDVAEPWEDSAWMAMVERVDGEWVRWEDIKQFIIANPQPADTDTLAVQLLKPSSTGIPKPGPLKGNQK